MCMITNKKKKRCMIIFALWEMNEIMMNFIYYNWQPLFYEAPIPPKEFQHSDTATTTLTCGYSICWNKSGLHAVILGTTGRKQGTSAKGAIYPSTESSLCKKRLLELFLSLKHEFAAECPMNEISYREMKVIFNILETVMHIFFKFNCTTVVHMLVGVVCCHDRIKYVGGVISN
ncbi:unnamed protein product [Camellia sinensis]